MKRVIFPLFILIFCFCAACTTETEDEPLPDAQQEATVATENDSGGLEAETPQLTDANTNDGTDDFNLTAFISGEIFGAPYITIGGSDKINCAYPFKSTGGKSGLMDRQGFKIKT